MRFKRSSLLTKLLILVLVVYATVTLVSLAITGHGEGGAGRSSAIHHRRHRAGKSSAAAGHQRLGTDEGVEAVARQKLGLVAKGEIIFYDVGN